MATGTDVSSKQTGTFPIMSKQTQIFVVFLKKHSFTQEHFDMRISNFYYMLN